MHEQQIVHRDVKPQNMIVSDDGITLVDFGIAREMYGGEEDPGTVGIGTPRFMAPEVFAGGAVSPRADVFGLAATLWTLITGKPPVYADTTELSDVAPGVSPELEETISKGLEMVPERRVASVAAFAKGARQAGAPRQGRVARLERRAPRRAAEPDGGHAHGRGRVRSGRRVDRSRGPRHRRVGLPIRLGRRRARDRGRRLPPGTGISGAVVACGEGDAVPDCRNDSRFASQIAAGTGYVPHTMLVVPLKRGDSAIGVLSLLDRRDGNPYGPEDMDRAALFAELAVTALDVEPDAFTSLGETRLGRA